MSTAGVTLEINVRGGGQWQAETARTRAATLALLRPIDRILYTYGEHHVDRVARDSLDRRLPADVVARRLLVAADLAAVIDGADVEDWSARERGRR